MPRGKLGMKLIENPKKRRAAYKNRRDGLVQKTSQLATLCGVDALLVCFDPKPAGAGHDGGGGGASSAVTTWPGDRGDVLGLIRRYRETPADKIRHSFTAAAYYQEELAKQQRKLLKIEQCGPDALALEDCRLADLSPADLGALLAALDETLRKAQQRIVALGGHVEDGGGDVLPAATAMVAAAPSPLLADYNSFDLAFSVPDYAGSMVTQYYYPPPLDMMLSPPVIPLQPPCLAFHQMPLPGYTFQIPPPPPLMAPFDMGMAAGTGTVDLPPFAMNLSHGGATGPELYDDFTPGFDATGGGVYVDGYVAGGGQSFAAGHTGGSYQHEHHLPAGVWPVMSGLNSNPGPMDDAAALKERIDFAVLPGSSSSSTSTSTSTCLQGGFQKK